MKIKLSLSRSQYNALISIIGAVQFDRINSGKLQRETIKEVLWKTYSRLGTRLTAVKADKNKVTLSTTEAWALMEGFKCMHPLGLYETTQINYLTGIIHQKTQ